MTAENGHLSGAGNLTENRHPMSKWQTAGRGYAAFSAYRSSWVDAESHLPHRQISGQGRIRLCDLSGACSACRILYMIILKNPLVIPGFAICLELRWIFLFAFERDIKEDVIMDYQGPGRFPGRDQGGGHPKRIGHRRVIPSRIRKIPVYHRRLDREPPDF